MAQDLIKKVPLNSKIELFEAITLFKDLYEEKSEQLASTELYRENDKVRVELLSITEAHFDFWIQLRQELNNAGLFARPAARIPSNINNANPTSTKLASGWFGTSAISSMEVKIDKAKAVKDFNE